MAISWYSDCSQINGTGLHQPHCNKTIGSLYGKLFMTMKTCNRPYRSMILIIQTYKNTVFLTLIVVISSSKL